MYGCCENVIQASHEEIIVVDKHKFRVIIVYCDNCGSLKTTTHVRHLRDGNKTEH
jgi:hypothetical protein